MRLPGRRGSRWRLDRHRLLQWQSPHNLTNPMPFLGVDKLRPPEVGRAFIEHEFGNRESGQRVELWISRTQAPSSSRNTCQRVLAWVAPVTAARNVSVFSSARALTTSSSAGDTNTGASGTCFPQPQRRQRCRRCRPICVRPLFGIIGKGILAIGKPSHRNPRPPAQGWRW